MTGSKNRFSYAKEPPKPQRIVPEKTEVLAQSKDKPRKVSKTTPTTPTPPAAGSAADALLHPAAYALPAQQRGRRSEEGLVKRTDVPREQLNVRIRPELKRAAAGMAGLQGMTLGDVVEAALIAYLDSKKDG